MGAMQTLIREKGSERWLSPDRDMIRIYPSVVQALHKNFSVKAMRATLGFTAVEGVTDAEFAAGMVVWRKFIESAIMDPKPNTYEAAKAAGLLDLKVEVRVAILAQLGMLFTHLYQDGAKDFKSFMDPTVLSQLAQIQSAKDAIGLFHQTGSLWHRCKRLIGAILREIGRF